MPRVNGIYQLPPGSYGQPGTTIESAKHNALADDLAADANAPRPITAGGTGATDKAGARTNLGFDDTYLRYDAAQPLTGAQKVQARANVGSAWEVISNQAAIAGQSQIVVTIPTGVRAIKMTGTLIPSGTGRVNAQLSTNAGAAWINSGYASQILNITGGSVSAGFINQAALILGSNLTPAAGNPVSFECSVDSLNNPGRQMRFRIATTLYDNAGVDYEAFIGGRILGVTTSVNAIRFFAESGTLSGDLLVEGLR